MKRMTERIVRGGAIVLALVLVCGCFGYGNPVAAGGEGTAEILKKYECEDAKVFDSTGKKQISMIRENDKAASGGATAGSTGGKFFLFENVPESNFIHIAYASPNTSSMLAQIRYPGEENFTTLCSISFSTSNSWYMSSSYMATSPMVYMPAGSDIRIKPAVDANLDYLYLTLEKNLSSEFPPENTVAAENFAGNNTKEDYMAPYGRCAELTEGTSFIFIPPGVDRTNILNFTYTTSVGAVLEVSCGGETGSIELTSTPRNIYRTVGGNFEKLWTGGTVKVTCKKGTVKVACIGVAYAEKTETVSIKRDGALKRQTVLLDGIWGVDALTDVADWQPPEELPAIRYANTAPVPGLFGNAACSLGDYTTTMPVYTRIIDLDEEPSETVLLNIGSAMYGRHIYVNGVLVDTYEYNYTSSSTEIGQYLHKGTNYISIALGSFLSQWNNPKSVAHVLNDGESSSEEPGILDSVELVFCGGPDVTAVQLAPDIDRGSIGAKVTLANREDRDASTDVKITVYELGLFKDGKALKEEVKVGEISYNNVNIEAGGTADVEIPEVLFGGFSREKCWSPESPFLYRAEIETAGDVYSVRFGMRTFGFEAGTGYALLNGERRFLFGTNVAIERFFDDPLCGTRPWNEAFIRKLYSEFQSVNWTCFRTHLGHANSKWFDIADETGMMIFDEYPTWGNDPTDTIKTIMPEIERWIEDRGYHPSLVVFDAQNESTNSLNDRIIKKGRDYDIQHRPWDNGWRPPVGETDPVECHPYIIGTSGISGLESMVADRPIVTTADIGWTAEDYPGHPFILNEHGEYWINREGKAMSGTAAIWNLARPGITDDERLTYYCDLMSAQIEAFRAGRAYTGLLFFCGLASSTSSAKGVTSDILFLSSDMSGPESLCIKSYFKYLMKNSYAPLGITIGTYTEKRTAGQTVEVPVTLVNDTGEGVEDLDVTLVILSGEKILFADRKQMSVSAYSPETGSDGTATEIFELKVPDFKEYCKEGSVLTVRAFYNLSGETVFSQRKWEIEGGDLRDGEPETYAWLSASELPKEYGAGGGWCGTVGSIDEDGADKILPILGFSIGGAALITAGVFTGIGISKKKKAKKQ